MASPSKPQLYNKARLISVLANSPAVPWAVCVRWPTRAIGGTEALKLKGNLCLCLLQDLNPHSTSGKAPFFIYIIDLTLQPNSRFHRSKVPFLFLGTARIHASLPDPEIETQQLLLLGICTAALSHLAGTSSSRNWEQTTPRQEHRLLRYLSHTLLSNLPMNLVYLRA